MFLDKDNLESTLDNLESTFLSIVKKDIKYAKQFIKFCQNAVADQLCRRQRKAHILYQKIVKNKIYGYYYHISQAIFDETRQMVEASTLEDVLFCYKEIVNYIFHIHDIDDDPIKNIDIEEFQVLFDLGINCVDFLSEEEYNCIICSTKEYIIKKMTK